MKELSIEGKELLFKDLCARLPYGIVVQQSAQYSENHFMYSVADKWKKEPHDFKIIGVNGTNTLITDKRKEENSYAKGIVSSPITICIYNNLTKQITKPYLRPMSSMTKDEKRELQSFYPGCFGSQWLDVEKGEIEIFECTSTIKLHLNDSVEIVDWLNSHHFDYRGLIKKGLAIEAPEGMYKTK